MGAARAVIFSALFVKLTCVFSVVDAYTLLEAAQVVEGKCLHEGKQMAHGDIIRTEDPCESYRCDTDKKMMLVDLCHYGIYQKAPPGCVLRKRTGDFPECCPWPDCSNTETIDDLSSTNVTSQESGAETDVPDLIVLGEEESPPAVPSQIDVSPESPTDSPTATEPATVPESSK
ncbi:uncharacterized protein LOC144166743 [Haemaphysalis longicornis]